MNKRKLAFAKEVPHWIYWQAAVEEEEEEKAHK